MRTHSLTQWLELTQYRHTLQTFQQFNHSLCKHQWIYLLLLEFILQSPALSMYKGLCHEVNQHIYLTSFLASSCSCVSLWAPTLYYTNCATGNRNASTISIYASHNVWNSIPFYCQELLHLSSLRAQPQNFCFKSFFPASCSPSDWRLMSSCLTMWSNGTNRHEIRAKTSIDVLCWTLMEECWKFSLKGVILPQNRHFGVVLTGFGVTRLQVTGYVFRLS